MRGTGGGGVRMELWPFLSHEGGVSESELMK